MSEPANMDEAFDVGGVRLARPFKLLRLGHFGINATDPEAAREFYCRLLGFRVSDPIDFGARLPEAERGKHAPGTGSFARHGRRLSGIWVGITTASIPSSPSTR